MSRLDGRVKVLERRGRLAAGCATCGGRMFHIVDSDEDIPPWLDASSCCRVCGAGVKPIDREAWDRL